MPFGLERDARNDSFLLGADPECGYDSKMLF
jgi:hypothetical protein